jgi:hypothetical protein
VISGRFETRASQVRKANISKEIIDKRLPNDLITFQVTIVSG